MLYALGSNGSGQLGVGHTEDLSRPEPISNGDASSPWKVKQLVAGGNHTIILCDDGKVRATGNNEGGRCGIVEQARLNQLTEVSLPLSEVYGNPLQVEQVAASWSSSTLLSTNGSVYVCGTGNSGELGLGQNVIESPTMQLISVFPPPGTEVTLLSCGMAHTVAVLSNGEVYGWGKGRKGQLGEPAHDVWAPRKITDIDFKATRAVCGKDFTVVVGKSSPGEMVVLGPNSRDRFGIKPYAPPQLYDWKFVSASWGSVYVLKASGEIVAWGRDDHGQLPPDGLPEIEAIAAGSEHCLALTKAGEVLAWGWGEHGNCGVPINDRSAVKGTWNEIKLPGRATLVFAGCATSFIWADHGVE